MNNYGWNALGYKEIQRKYQNNIGKELIEEYEKIFSLKGLKILDVGSGDGYLTNYLREKSGKNSYIYGIDSDKAMCELAREKYKKYENMCIYNKDAIFDIGKFNIKFDLIFSNATIHWFGSYDNLEIFMKNIYNSLEENGKFMCRFSLFEHARKSKNFLEDIINKFYNKKDIKIKKSIYEFNKVLSIFIKQDFDLILSKQIWFNLFKKNDENNLKWLIYSQPLNNYIRKEDYDNFINFLKDEWEKQKIRVEGHHGMFILQK